MSRCAPPLLVPWLPRPPRLDRKEFYDLTVYCREYALELAHYDQHKVNLKQCNHFNDWLRGLRRYEELAPALASLRPARPIARWQIMVLLFVVWFIVALATRAASTISSTWCSPAASC